ncbi:MAG: hypothetical protein ACM3L6_06695 [Deltaproteobacteria bacterium]
MKKILMALLIAAGAFAILVLFRNALAETFLSKGIRSLTGLDTRVERVDIGLFRPTLSLKGFTLLNPPGFQEETMARFPELFVAYDLPAFMNHRVHLPEVRIDLDELVVVRNSGNKLNLDALKTLAQAKEQPGAGKPAAEQAAPGKPPEIRIDVLRLKINEVVYEDYSQVPPSVRHFSIQLDKTFRDITDPKALVNLIVVNALSKTALSGVLNVDLSQLQGEVSGVLRQQGQALQQELTQKIQEGVSGAAKETAGKLTDMFTRP